MSVDARHLTAGFRCVSLISVRHNPMKVGAPLPVISRRPRWGFAPFFPDQQARFVDAHDAKKSGSQ